MYVKARERRMGAKYDDVRGAAGRGARALHLVHPEGECYRMPVPPREEREGDDNNLRTVVCSTLQYTVPYFLLVPDTVYCIPCCLPYCLHTLLLYWSEVYSSPRDITYCTVLYSYVL